VRQRALKWLGLSPTAQEGQDARQQWWGRALVHGGRVGFSASTWRASAWPEREAILGRFWAELDLGPKTKVGAHTKLYVFH
jgi:hypothetical protein